MPLITVLDASQRILLDSSPLSFHSMNSLFGFCNKALLTLREPLFPFAEPFLIGKCTKPWSNVAAVTHTFSPTACQVKLSLKSQNSTDRKIHDCTDGLACPHSFSLSIIHVFATLVRISGEADRQLC